MPRKRKKPEAEQQAVMGGASTGNDEGIQGDHASEGVSSPANLMGEVPLGYPGGEQTAAVTSPATEPLGAAPAIEQATQEAVERSERPKPQMRGVAMEIIGNKRVRLIDNGNAGGVGIKIEGLAEGEKPPESVINILRENDGVRLIYRNDMDKSWMTRVDPMNPSGTRRAVEKKFAAVVEQMRAEAEHEAPPLP